MVLETAALSLIDRLIQSVKTRQDDKKKLLTDHIEPLFTDLSQIHAGYLSDFTALLNMPAPPGGGLSRELYAAVIEKKVGLENIRVKAHALAHLEREGLPEASATFFQACRRYFASFSGWNDKPTYFVELGAMLESAIRTSSRTTCGERAPANKETAQSDARLLADSPTIDIMGRDRSKLMGLVLSIHRLDFPLFPRRSTGLQYSSALI